MLPLISVIIPVFNEEENVDHLVGELNQYFEAEKEFRTEIIFVNDGSKDQTLQKLRTADHRSYRYKIISFSKNFGSHAALRAGILRAAGDYITFMYADLQDPLELVGGMFREASKGFDIVWAYRRSVKAKVTERVFSRMYSNLMRQYAVPNFPKTGFDVVLFSNKVRNCLNENIEANSSIFIQILTLGFRQSNVIYDKRSRTRGKSKWTLSKKIKLLIDSFVAFSFAPIRLVSILGITFFFIGMIWIGYLLLRKIFFDDLVSGWPALMSVLLIGFGITNISLGVIAEYLWRTLDASRKRPVFVIDEIIEPHAE